MKAHASAAHRDAVAELVRSGVGLELVEESDGLAGGIANAAGVRAATIEFLEDRKRDDDGITVGQILKRVGGRNQNTRVDYVNLATVRLCHQGSRSVGTARCVCRDGILVHPRRKNRGCFNTSCNSRKLFLFVAQLFVRARRRGMPASLTLS